MKTPALDRRIVVLGTSAVLLLLLSLDLVVYLAVPRVEAGSVAAVVDARAALVLLAALLTPLLTALAWLLLRWITEIALAPLDRVAEATRRTAAGKQGERLRPDRPGTRLGQMASTYDEMLDALEGAVAAARAAEDESRTLHERTRTILETAREAFIAMDADGTVIEWNAQAERMFGWPRAEVLGRLLVDVVVPPDWRAAYLSGLMHFLEGGRGGPAGRGTVEVSAMRREGTQFPAELTLWLTDHGGRRTCNAFLRDITDAKRSIEAMSRLAAIVQSADRAILSTDLQGTVVTWNPGAERLYGYPAAEAVGRDLGSLVVPDEHRAVLEQILATVASGQEVDRAEVVRRARGGGLLEVAVAVAPLRDPAGQVYGACAVERDITNERWIAAQLELTLAALTAALDEAQRTEASTRRFLDDAAHQLRTPLTTIGVCTETLLRGVTPDQADQMLTALAQESARAARLVAGLLRMARLDGARPPAVAATDVLALCRREADRVGLQSPDLEITVTATGALPPGRLDLNADAVVEILSNLADNARRHARSRIDLEVRRDHDSVWIGMRDDGPGLPDGQALRAFERFASLDSYGGTGLGLPIACELARVQGGELTYESGAFVLRLPCGMVEPVTRPCASSFDS